MDHEVVLWDAVDRLIDRAPGLDELRAHRIQLLAARRLRARGADIPPGLLDEERRATVTAMVAPAVVSAVRDALAGPVLIFKGPETAALYPDPLTRSFTDLDLLVEEPGAAHRALRESGFREIGDPKLYEGIHHLRPLALPSIPLPVEIHAGPKWIDWHAGPPASELIRGAVPSSLAIDGLLTLSPEHHTLVLAAHSWAHEPLRRAADLIDVAAAAQHADPALVEALAETWGLGRVWRTTRRAIDGLLSGEPPPRLRLVWARNVYELRERTVLESHLTRWLSRYAAHPPARAFREMAAAVARDLRRDRGDTWGRKLRRSARAVGAARTPRSEHDRVLEQVGANRRDRDGLDS